MGGRQVGGHSRDSVRDLVTVPAGGPCDAARSLVRAAGCPVPVAGVFGSGSGEPYARALRRGGGSLTLRPEGGDPGAWPGAGVVEFDVLGWCVEASALEVGLLQGLKGPVLDVGCGPGRMLSAARALGLGAVGLDTSAEAVALARSRGVRALHQSVRVVAVGVVAGRQYRDRWKHCPVLGRCRELVAARGLWWSKRTRTRTLTSSIRRCRKTVPGTGANRFPGRGLAGRGWWPVP